MTQIPVDTIASDNSIPSFLSFAIEEYKNHKGISGEEAAYILDKSGVLNYLADCYDVLHTQSRQWLLEEIDDMISKSNPGR